MTIPFIIIMLLLALFIVYFNMSSRVRYLLWMLCLRLYSPILITCKVGGIAYVSMVLRYVMSAIIIYMQRSGVDHRGDSLIESFVVLPLCIRSIELGREGGEDIVLNPP